MSNEIAPKNESKIENMLETLIFNARWILVVFYVVLVISLLAFAAKFATIFWHYITHIFDFNETETLIELLGIVDMTLLANLILIVIFSGYENFVSVIGAAVSNPDRPKWMGEVDFAGLKLKLIGSMVALSGIKLLGVFLSIPLDQALIDKAGLRVSIEKGLRAKLQQQSVITGVLYVELDYFPDTAYRLHDTKGGQAEIPTLPSNLGALTRAVSQTLDQLSRVDFVAITKKVDSILGRIDQGASQIEFAKINGNLVKASDNIARITGDPAIAKAVEDFSAAMKSVDTLVKRLNQQVDPVADDIKSMATAGRKALERLNETAENLRTLTKAGSPTRRELDTALADVSEAAAAIRSLADFIERNPETIIQGRSKQPAAEKKTAPAPAQ